MLREKMLALRRLHTVTDVLITVLAFFTAGFLTHVIKPGSFAWSKDFSVVASNLIIIAIIWAFLILKQKDPYAYRVTASLDIIRNTIILTAQAACGYLIWLFITKSEVPGRLFFGLFITIDFILLLSLRLIVSNFLQIIRARGKNLQQMFIVGTGREAKKVVDDIMDNPKWGMNIKGILSCNDEFKLWRYRDVPMIGSLDCLPELIQRNQVDYVIFACDPKFIVNIKESIEICEEMGVKACLLTDFFPTKLARKKVGEFLYRPAIIYTTVQDYKLAIFAKSIFDRFAAIIGLILGTPIILLSALAVKLTSRGPVFFTQERCGLNGRRFKLYKFRTMIKDAEKLKKKLEKKNEMDGPVFKIKDDPRITRIGKFLRKTSLDELPQLINVVRGDMSFVGPRPPLPSEVEKYDRWQRRKLSVKPGLTCLWQVGDRNDTTFEEWMKLDLEYIDKWSPWLDAKILIKTIPTVINGTGR